jgi:hypothetical protein
MTTENLDFIGLGDTEKIREADSHELDHPELTELLEIERTLAAAIVAEPISADCHAQYHAYHKSGRRPLSAINLIVMHATQGGTARSVAVYFRNPKSGGSATLVVDDYSCYRCLADNEIPWGAPGANYNGFHIEQCGYASWTAVLWSKTHRRTLMRAAYKAAYHAKKYGLKPRFLTAANLKAGMRNGITTHAECTKAFGGSHTDPGKGWPRLLFMTMVRGYYAVLKVKKVA